MEKLFIEDEVCKDMSRSGGEPLRGIARIALLIARCTLRGSKSLCQSS
jgi:hypothetical protein